MTDPNLLFSPDLSLNLLSKSSPSHFNNRTRIPPEQFYTTNNSSSSVSKQPIANSNKPSNLSHVPCKFFKQGTCTAGANCTFSHSSDLSSENAVCKYFLKGNCKFGTKCALLHTMSVFSNKTSSNNNNNNRMIAMTPPNPSSFIDYQPMMSFSPPTNYPPLDLFGTSAPSLSLFRNNNNNIISNDFIGLHSSPRESSNSTASMDYLLGTSPFSQKTNDLFSRQPKPNEVDRVPFYNKFYQDDDVQFYMEDDEALTSLDDHKTLDMINTTKNNNNNNSTSSSSNSYNYNSLLGLSSSK